MLPCLLPLIRRRRIRHTMPRCLLRLRYDADDADAMLLPLRRASDAVDTYAAAAIIMPDAARFSPSPAAASMLRLAAAIS